MTDAIGVVPLVEAFFPFRKRVQFILIGYTSGQKAVAECSGQFAVFWPINMNRIPDAVPGHVFKWGPHIGNNMAAAVEGLGRNSPPAGEISDAEEYEVSQLMGKRISTQYVVRIPGDDDVFVISAAEIVKPVSSTSRLKKSGHSKIRRKVKKTHGTPYRKREEREAALVREERSEPAESVSLGPVVSSRSRYRNFQPSTARQYRWGSVFDSRCTPHKKQERVS